MVTLKFEGLPDDFNAGVEIISKEMGFNISREGIPVKIERRPGNIEVVLDNGYGAIKFNRKIEFFRALGLFVENIDKGNFKITEVPQFDMNGAMFDVSRNTVLKPEKIKEFLRIMAVMGLDTFLLYMEDTYTIEDKPYFGYMRGRYSYNELKECDIYADYFGIEIIPCIQTLAHLKQAIKWKYAEDIKDTDDILLVGEEKTYKFIEEMIKAASSPFRTKRIHIGMDEADNLGLGKYLKKNGFRRRFDIMTEHLARVVEITSQLGLKPMIWSDMFFRIASKSGDYYDIDADIPTDVVKKIPKEVQLTYWDYYHKDEDFYSKFINKHKKIGSVPVFAGGLWTWNGIAINYGRAFTVTNAALSACKKEGVREVFATLWGDDGSETNLFSALLGLQLYAEHGYSREISIEKLKKRFSFCVKADYDAFMDLRYLDEVPGTEENNLGSANPSKFLLYQDILLGLFDYNVSGLNISKHYSNLAQKLKRNFEKSERWSFIFKMPLKLCTVLALKAELGIKLKKAYDAADTNSMALIAKEDLPKLRSMVAELKDAHREQWFEAYKPFGWEVLDIRYGGLLARIDTAVKRINDFLDGKVDRIEELEEERLYFHSLKNDPGFSKLGRVNRYGRIVTAGMFTGF